MDTSTNGSSDAQCRFKNVDYLLQPWLFLYLTLIPLFVFVLYVGYQQHQKQSPPSHSDVFTYNIIAMEIVAISSSTAYIIGLKFKEVFDIGGHVFSIGAIGQLCFHCLTCVDRYLAVAHPVTYLRLKERGGVEIRNIGVVGSWVISVGFGILELFTKENSDMISEIILSFLFFAVVVFCSISVLCVLIRPGPGDLRRIDQSKQRAFVKIVIIMALLLLKLVFFSAGYLVGVLDSLNYYGYCMPASLLNYPSSLVLPLMFLQKYKKLPKISIMNCKLQFKSKN